MLSSITPLGERGRNNRWSLTVTAFVIGATGSGLLVGAAAGALGSLLDLGDAQRLLIAAAAALIALAIELRLAGLRLPTIRRQVNENWLQRYRGWVYGVGFGLQLGSGFATIITTAAVPLAFAFACLSGTVAGGAAIGGAFGLVRGLMILPARRVRDTEGLVTLHGRIASTSSAAARVTTGVLAASVIACALGAVA